jgi:AbrB family looped-hinge helix DNA binding protein
VRILKLFGQRGRITIPLPMREKLGWQVNDLLAFREKGGAVIITREYTPQAPADQPPAAKGILQLLLLLIGGGGHG